ncbi:hypothetical protein CALCODRAFT_558101 [Calocera cornea HHB12733]|uniref:F-box domain-containing protein n=1 Tax=Calocera cornea HHB12733 TaxID=1353952 RepID=A0A165DA60_9BASI|nr:hypothetical protein CALCODRAFT_558101 [Calocera cornea HHB12733]
MFEVWHESGLPFTNILLTCRGFYDIGRRYLYLGTKFYWDSEGTLMQSKGGLSLPAHDFVLRTAEEAKVLRRITIHRFKDPQLGAETSAALSVGLAALHHLELFQTWITQEVLTTITGIANLSILQLTLCNIGPEAHLSQMKTSPSVRIHHLEIMGLGFSSGTNSSQDAQKWAADEACALFKSLAGPCLRILDFALPHLLVDLSATRCMIELLQNLAETFALLPISITHLRWRTPLVVADLATMRAISTLFTQWTSLRVLLVPLLTLEVEWELHDGLLPALQHLSGPMGFIEALLPYVGQHLESIHTAVEYDGSPTEPHAVYAWKKEGWPNDRGPKTLILPTDKSGRDSHEDSWIYDILAQLGEPVHALEDFPYVYQWRPMQGRRIVLDTGSWSGVPPDAPSL